jgi:cell division transport system permease protein
LAGGVINTIFMFLLSFFRVVKFSFQDMGRNIWLTIATITILILALFSINLLITVNVITNTAIRSVKEKIDINLYIKADVKEDKIMALKAKISEFDQVKEIKYISKADALESFKVKYKNNPEIMDALRELGKNPLTPILVIKANNIDEYDDLIGNLNKIDDEIIESRNFENHKLILEKINNISHKINRAGIAVSLIFVFISILVVFNAIRVAIYTHRKEIAIMRLVGASNWFVRSPFFVSGIIYALIGTLFVVALYYPFLTLLQPYLETFFVDYNINIVSYFNENFIKIFGLQFLGAALINIIASFTALGRYSKV